MTLKIIFMGTPDFAIPSLAEIINKELSVVGVYTQPPRPAGRGTKLRRSPVHEYAETAGLNVFTPKSFKSDENQQQFIDLQADVAIVVAYGLLLPKPILDTPRLGCLNVHGSLLPRWRGAAPIQRAIMAGDEETGVMIQQMNEGLDTGDILLADHISIGPNMTAGMLHDEMMHKGASLLGRALDALERGSLVATPQTKEGVTYAKKILKSETEINWQQKADDIHNHIRGLSPYPGAWTPIKIGGKFERLKILQAEIAGDIEAPFKITENEILIGCKEGALRLKEVQRPGKKPLLARDFINGVRDSFELDTI